MSLVCSHCPTLAEICSNCLPYYADPEVSALSTLTNVQNSLFIPHLGTWINRQPTYTLSPPPHVTDSLEETTTTEEGEGEELSEISKRDSKRELRQPTTLDRLHSVSSLSSVLEDPRFAVLPEGHNLEGWTKADAAELNDHVRHMLHSRRSKFKRAMKGFGQYVSKRKSMPALLFDLSTTNITQQLASSSPYMQPSLPYLDLHGFFSSSVRPSSSSSN